MSEQCFFLKTNKENAPKELRTHQVLCPDTYQKASFCTLGAPNRQDNNFYIIRN